MALPTIDQYVTVDKYRAPQWLGNRATRRFHVMAKPAGSTCNLDCTYCFYLSKQTLPGGPAAGTWTTTCWSTSSGTTSRA